MNLQITQLNVAFPAATPVSGLDLTLQNEAQLDLPFIAQTACNPVLQGAR
ncbi:MAG: hypothetical protein ACRDJU_14615 [Actinomycetota bacterium]